jgi:hypothetical protein
MPMREKDFELVASSIRYLRNEVKSDLDQSYEIDGAIVLDRLTEQLADDFASRYPSFNHQVAFLRISLIRQGFDRFADQASSSPCVGFHTACTVKSDGSRQSWIIQSET